MYPSNQILYYKLKNMIPVVFRWECGNQRHTTARQQINMFSTTSNILQWRHVTEQTGFQNIN